MDETTPLKRIRPGVSRKFFKADAVPLKVKLALALPPTVTATSLPLTVSVGLPPVGPAATDSTTMRVSLLSPMALAKRSSPLIDGTVSVAGTAKLGRAVVVLAVPLAPRLGAATEVKAEVLTERSAPLALCTCSVRVWLPAVPLNTNLPAVAR